MEMDTESVKSPPAHGTVSRRTKHITAVCIYYCTFALGCGFTILSPTLVDFKNKYDTGISNVSVALTILTAFYLFGALMYGILTMFIRRQILVICLLSLMSLSIFVIPHLKTLTLLYVFSALLGFGSGTYDTSQIAWMIDLWREEAAPFILTQHFAFSVGTIAPPLILGPYLTKEEEKEEDRPDKCRDLTRTTSAYTSSSSSVPTTDSDLVIPFSIIGAIIAFGVLIQIVLYIKLWNVKTEPPMEESEEKKPNNVDDETTMSSKPTLMERIKANSRLLTIVFLSCCTLGLYQGMEVTTMNFIPTFGVYGLCMTTSQAADMLFYFTLAYSIGRGLGIVIVLKVPPHFILFCNFALIITGNTIMLIMGQESTTWLTISAVILGAGMSTFYPSYYAWIEHHIHVTDRIASIAVMTGGLVSAVYPLIVGTAVEDNPSILNYVNFFSICVCTLAFGATFYITMIRGKKSK